jgi:hypothetical protein
VPTGKRGHGTFTISATKHSIARFVAALSAFVKRIGALSLCVGSVSFCYDVLGFVCDDGLPDHAERVDRIMEFPEDVLNIRIMISITTNLDDRQ